jgi:hypothetical protein
MGGYDEELTRLFILGCLAIFGIKWMCQKFTASNPEVVEDVKKKAENKAIDLINRWLG